MRCLKPRTVGFLADGKTISWSPKSYSKEYPTFQLPCSKCIECRLEYARQWAVRSVHEASMFENNSFITLTYADEHLDSPKLQYRHFQLFAKSLRKKIYTDYVKGFGIENWKQLSKAEKKEHYEKFSIGIFVTGEYGDLTKRPHWHAIIFNWQPRDLRKRYTSDSGHVVYSSTTLDNLWKRGKTEVGSVNFDSAGYVARYAAKKLVHGHDGHEYEPISKKSSRQAIGKRFLEKYWKDIFSYGEVLLPDGQKTAIPRYYEKWLLKNHPESWRRYVTEIKQKRINEAEAREQRETERYWETSDKRRWNKPTLVTKKERKSALIHNRFKKLQKFLKGDI